MKHEKVPTRKAAGKYVLALQHLGNFLLLAQPFLALLVFLSVFTGQPPLWFSWSIALFPSVLRWRFNKRLFPRTPFDIPIIISTAAMLLGYFLSSEQALANAAMNTYLAGLLLYYSLVGNGQAKRGYWLTVTIFLIIVCLLIAVLVFAGGEGKLVLFNVWIYTLAANLHFSDSLTMHSNVLGVIFAIWLPVLLAIAIFTQKQRLRFIAVIGVLVCGFLLILSASGGGWIAAGIGLSVVLLIRSFRLLISVVFSLCLIAGITSPIWYGAEWIGNVLPFQNLLARADFWQATIASLKEYPIFGLGLGGWWSNVHTNMLPLGPHNTYLQMYSDGGLIGLIAIVAIIVSLLILIRKILHSCKNTPDYGLAVGIFAGIVVTGALACIENVFVVVVPVGEKLSSFTIPLIWVILAVFVIVTERLLSCTENIQENP